MGNTQREHKLVPASLEDFHVQKNLTQDVKKKLMTSSRLKIIKKSVSNFIVKKVDCNAYFRSSFLVQSFGSVIFKPADLDLLYTVLCDLISSQGDDDNVISKYKYVQYK
jgi:hypothetical protein